MIPPDKDVLKEAIKQGFTVKGLFEKNAYHKGSHPKYTQRIEDRIKATILKVKKGKISLSEAATEVDDLIKDAKKAISAGNGKSVNDITF